jgi:hypothetical protein
MSNDRIRMCFFKVPGLLDMRSQVDQPLNNFVRAWFEIRPALNVTWIETESVGSLRDPVTLEYDGCIGMIQRNESDFGVTMSDYRSYGEKITPWSVVFGDKTVIGTVYKKLNLTESGSATRVMDFLEGYAAEDWVCTIVIGFLLCLLSFCFLAERLRSEILYENRFKLAAFGSVHMVITCFVNQHLNISSMRPPLNQFYFLMTLLGFFTGYFLTSMIKTDMLLIDPPESYKSYQDLLDHDVPPLWFQEAGSHGSFQVANNGSLEKKIWDRAVERGLNKSILSFAEMLGKTPALAMNAIIDVFDRKSVFLMSGVYTRLLDSNACAFTRQNDIKKDVNNLAIADPSAQDHFKVMLGSAVFDPGLKWRVSSGMTRKFEMGTILPSIFNSYSFAIASTAGHFVSVDECMSGIILMPDHDVVPVPVTHYWDLCLLSLILLLIAGTILRSEVVRKKRWLRNPNREIRIAWNNHCNRLRGNP